MGPFEVEAKHIESFAPLQLTRLLKRLLYLEAGAYGIPFVAPHVPLQINVPDGGEDGRIKWDGGPDKTDFLPKRFVMFQIKAKKMTPKECSKEILTDDGKKIKEQVAEVLNEGGTYIVFCCKPYHKTYIKKKILAIRNTLRKNGIKKLEQADINFYDGNIIAGWVNKYFAAQIYVRSCGGQNIPFGLKTWEDWAKHEDFMQDYILNDKLKEYKESLQKELGSVGKSVVRVTGLSGLGKTRLALEVFRDEDATILTLQNNVLYFDAPYEGGENLANFLADSRNSNLRMILVVDNCEPRLHERFAREMGYGKHNIKLITIDYDPSKVNSGSRSIHITQDDCNEIVKGILQKRYPRLSGSVLNRIEEFAQNFASIAVLLAKQVQQGVEDIGRLSDDQLAKKLLWGRGNEDKSIVKVIRACSLFDYVEFSEEECTNEVKFLSKEIARVSEQKFFEICCRYLKLGILQKRGRFIRVCPIPLAIRLAAEWWDTTPVNEIVRFTEKLNKIGLLERFCEQAKMLHFSRKAREVVEKLCGPQGDIVKCCG
jgi:hypothetical protein